MDFDLSNLLKHFNCDQKRIITAFVFTVPIAYVICLLLGGEIFYSYDLLTRIFFALSLDTAFISVNYIAIIIGQGITELYTPFRYLQLLLPQTSTLVILLYTGFYNVKFALLLYATAFVATIAAHIFVRLCVGFRNAHQQTDALPDKHKKRKKQNRNKHIRRQH